MPNAQRLLSYLESDPDNLSLLADCIDALLNEGQAKQARPYAEHALRLAPQDAGFQYRHAAVLSHLGEHEPAIKLLQTLAAAGQTHPVPLYLLAELLYKQKQFADAVQTLELLRVQPNYGALAPHADLLLLRALHVQGKLDEAIDLGQQLLAQDGSRQDIRAALASMYLDNEQLEAAQKIFAEAQQQGELPAELQCVGGYLALEQEQLDEASKRFATALNLRPSDGRSLLGAALVTAARGDLQRAMTLMQQAASSMGSHLGTWVSLGWLQLVAGQIDEAKATFNQALALDRNFSETHGGLAAAAALQGDTELAQEKIRTAKKLDANGYSAAFAEMLLQHGLQDRPALLKSIQQFMVSKPGLGKGSLYDSLIQFAKAKN